MKKNKGITLISLVITIIILIILTSVAIYLGLSNNGIFTEAKQAKETTNKQTATEIINLKITTAQMNSYADKQVMPTLKELSLLLKEDNEISYVTEKSQVSSTKYEVGDNPSSIFTKLNKYPYEFEINGQLQLASIDGIKIATNVNTNTVGITGFSKIFEASQTSKDINTYIFKDFSTSIDFVNFNKYLEMGDNLLTIKEEGWYKIDSQFSGYSPRTTTTWATAYIIVNGITIKGGYSEAVNDNSGSFCDSISHTLYLKKGDTISFQKDISTANFSSRCNFTIELYKL